VLIGEGLNVDSFLKVFHYNRSTVLIIINLINSSNLGTNEQTNQIKSIHWISNLYFIIIFKKN
jgi:hypothetical protein